MAHNRLHIDGGLGSNAERWSVGMAFSTPDNNAVDGPTLLTTWCDAVLTLLNATSGWALTMKGSLGSTGTIDRVRAYHYPGIQAPADSAGASTIAGSAGSGTAYHPPQCSAVVSLNTGIPGRSTRGRFYWPLVNGTISSTMKWTSNPAPATFATAAAAMLDAIRDAATGVSGLEPVVVSPTASLITPVISVTVDNVIDTQRRRRDALLGTKFTAAIPV